MIIDPKKLIERAKQGDNKSFGELYEHFFVPIYRYIYLRLGNKQSAEDLTQIVFIKVYEHLAKIEITSSDPLAYFFTVARNTIIDFQRKKRPEYLEDMPELMNSLEEKTATPDEHTNTQLDIGRLQKALHKISEAQQEIIILKFINQLSNAEIAHTIGKTEEAIRQLQFRALKALREALN